MCEMTTYQYYPYFCQKIIDKMKRERHFYGNITQ